MQRFLITHWVCLDVIILGYFSGADSLTWLVCTLSFLKGNDSFTQTCLDRSRSLRPKIYCNDAVSCCICFSSEKQTCIRILPKGLSNNTVCYWRLNMFVIKRMPRVILYYREIVSMVVDDMGFSSFLTLYCPLWSCHRTIHNENRHGQCLQPRTEADQNRCRMLSSYNTIQNEGHLA